MTKQEILDYLDNVLHPIVSPDNWNVYSELHDMIEELPSAQPTVEAIPVEFIKSEIKENKGFYNSNLHRLLDVWAERKEE